MVMLILALLLFAASAQGQDVATYVPKNAEVYLPILKAEQKKFWPDHPAPALLAALVEQESCITLRHPKCWNPTSRLKSAREEGAGFGQITRAYRSDGSLRFDALQEMVVAYPKELEGWNWGNVYSRPDMQLRGMVLKVRGDFRRFPATISEDHRLAFSDAAYNGGYGGVEKERTACSLSRGCNPKKWWANVESYCLKSLEPLYGRNACEINREHVTSVFKVRPFKYITYW